ncbi:RimK/LysX family protein [Aquisalimonas sp.]|uniref:ATP-dependent zinc protease family protein n=1 Tax=Aquisalimonas sp. TaxID=1872621 RepID=UPI0025B7BCA8|nr:RimK/LysX family protein [Aquisalimonas sp.]
MRKQQPKLTTGWREWAALPQLNIPAIKVKVDTGALSSALHAIHVRYFTEAGRERVAFEIHPIQRRSQPTVRCTAHLVGERLVTSSNGHRERRPVIRTQFMLGGLVWPIDLTLTNRDSMGFRMLLGRRAMRRRVLVNPSASFVCGAPDRSDTATAPME